MAIIKCPECGHQISDMAATCPNCGVEIKGNIVKCPHCGNVYIKGQAVCPACHKSANDIAAQRVQPVSNIQSQTATNSSLGAANAQRQPAPKNTKNIIVAIFAAAIIVIGGIFWYATSQNDLHGDEQEAYLNAMNSSDPSVLQDYLDSFRDAPQEHIDSIEAHLKILQLNDAEWTNALLSNSKTALQQYLEKHPGTIHQTEIEHKIDSIDWSTCSRQNTPEAYQEYLNDHANGEHAVDAKEKLDKLDATTVNGDDKQMVASAFRKFFNGINNNDEMGITSAVSSVLHFLTNPNATKSDVITFLHKLYKDDVRGLTWRPNGDYKIQKHDNGDGTYEYDVEFTVDEQVSNIDSSKDKFNQYKVKGHIDSDGKISGLELIKIG